jgi:LemA protein
MIVLIILAIGLVAVIAWYTMYNSIIKNKNEVENNKSTIQTVMQNRYDLIPNLVEVVKKYTKYEKGALESVIKMRNQLTGHDNVDASAAQEENMLTGTLKSIFALAESYPDLKADTQFTQLQNQLIELEDRMQAARR